MTRGDEMLRQACALAAREETEQLEYSLTDGEIQEAEALFDRHKHQAFQLIARHAGSPSSRRWIRALRAAACLLALGGGLFAALRSSPPPEGPPLSGAPSPTVAPYTAPEPLPVPTDLPEETAIPTYEPTISPNPTIFVTESPTEAPKNQEEKTPSPTDPASGPLAPGQWTGEFFPQELPGEYALALVTQGDGVHTAAYAWEDKELVFTEYDAARSVSLPEQAERDYVQLPGGPIALRLITDEGVMLAWDEDGRTLTLFGEEADVLSIAGTVVRLR